MNNDIGRIREEVLGQIREAGDIEALQRLRTSVLGRKGALTEVLRGLSKLPLDDRKRTGEAANRVREELQQAIEERESAIRSEELSRRLAGEKIDATLPRYPLPEGHLHPLRQTLDEISSIFESLGFSVAEGPEIETDWYNFEALNIPPDHPARDTQDTFYLDNYTRLLRTHTSPVQVHVMEKRQPPVRIIAPGRVYRNEATDATHSAIFHQIEGLAVDEDITFSDLKGTLTLFIRRYFGSKVGIRLRPSHFQFTEPSAEVDVQCIFCSGAGCRICKNSGWIEMIGCGMVHPNVLRAVDYDPEKYTGFAFGIGVERLALFKYDIDDIRIFYENDLRVLNQF